MMSNDSYEIHFVNTTELDLSSNLIQFSGVNELIDNLAKADENKLYLLILIGFVFVLSLIALYLFYLYLKSLRRRRHLKSKLSSSRNDRELQYRDPMTDSFEDISDIQMKSGSFVLNDTTALPPKELLNLQPAANDLASIHDEFRSIIASKLKPPPSTLEGLQNKENSMDVEIKQERENDDVFSVISTKSLERFKISKIKNDKPNAKSFESDTTESEQQDKVIVLKSGTNLDGSSRSRTNRSGRPNGSSKLLNRSKSRPSSRVGSPSSRK